MQSLFFYETELGTIGIAEDGTAITRVAFGRWTPGKDETEGETPLLAKAAAQLREYLSGKRRAFELPLAAQGTEFQRRVWQALTQIPYGETRSYKDIAVRVGNPKGSRAIGMANHCNPIAIIVPCHRVIGAKGAMVGYASGVDIKQRLLELESL